MVFFCSDRESIFAQYKTIFNGNGSSSGSIAKLLKEYARATGWANVVEEIAEGNPVIIHQVYKQKLEEFLDYYTVRTLKRELESKIQEEHIKNARKKNKG